MDGSGKSLAAVAAATETDLKHDAGDLAESVSKETGATITFDAGKPDNDSMGVVREALKNAGAALTLVGSDELGRSALKKVHKVVVTSGAKADTKLAGDTVTLTIAPKLGHDGRPSSLAIKKVLENGL